MIYENHHILPKSLGGTNDKNNLVLLTLKEHFICHWLLVKIYPKGSKERGKMLCAFWRMQGNPSNKYKRYINARAYEKLRSEFIQYMSKIMKTKQKGINNSQYGYHWFTNRNTGECKKFKIPPDVYWIKGNRLFRGETTKLNYVKLNQKNFIRQMWNKYHSENWTCVSQFGAVNNIIECRRKFRRWIPYFKKISDTTKHNRFNFPSNKELIGVYE